MTIPQRMKPVNRHILIAPHFKKEDDTSGVLLPEDYRPVEDKYISATILDVANDCSRVFTQYSRETRRFHENSTIIVDRAMIEKISYSEKDFYMILENYVCAIVKES